MKVALVIDDSLDRSDGVQQYVLTLGGWLKESGHNVHFISSGSANSENSVHNLSPNVGVRFNKNKLKVPLPASPRKIQDILTAKDFDVVHVQMPFSPQLAGRLIKGLSDDVGLVGTFHILPFGRVQTIGGKLLGWLTRPQLRRFDKVISVSKPAGQHAATTYSIQSPVHIPNAVNLQAFKVSASIVPGRIVFLGRLVPRKGCMELLKAVRLLRKNHMPHNFELIIAGTGPERGKLESYCKRHKLDGVVTFEGYVTEDRKKQLLASAQIAVFPSLGGESFGIVLLEAMAAGAEVVLAGDNPGYKSVMGSVPAAIINPRSPKELALTLRQLLQDESARQKIHAKQQNLVQKYDIGTVGPQITKIYTEVIEKRRHPGHTKGKA